MVNMLYLRQRAEIGWDGLSDFDLKDKEHSVLPKTFEDEDLEALLDEDRCQTLYCLIQ